MLHKLCKLGFLRYCRLIYIRTTGYSPPGFLSSLGFAKESYPPRLLLTLPGEGEKKTYSLNHLITQSLPQPAPTSILPHKGGRLLMMNLSWTVVSKLERVKKSLLTYLLINLFTIYNQHPPQSSLIREEDYQ